MAFTKPTVIVTGIAGNLGLRLLPQLQDFSVVGVDINEPKTSAPLRFVPMDLGFEESCRTLYHLIRETRPVALIHLAFVIDPVRTGILDLDRMWQINVAGTARVMEAITEANRNQDDGVRQFVFPSSVSAYGSDLPKPVTENFPLGGHTLPYVIHKKESDRVVQQRASALRGCSVYIFRPHIFAGATVENYLIGAFRGTPNGQSKRAVRMREEGKRLPCMLPFGQRYLVTSFVDNQKRSASLCSTSPVAASHSPLPSVSRWRAPNWFACRGKRPCDFCCRSCGNEASLRFRRKRSPT